MRLLKLSLQWLYRVSQMLPLFHHKSKAKAKKAFLGGPSIQNEKEDGKMTPQVIRPSPLKQFRSRKILSVSDLVSPSWCEVQFDYGLRGKRYHPIGKRPKSFVSSSGKIISVEKSIAEKNDVSSQQGRAVHKELERELQKVKELRVRKELELEIRKVTTEERVRKALERELRKVTTEVELRVDISSEETRWALRLVNMLACLKFMLVDGYTREMPVFGIVNDEVLVGIVDEVIQDGPGRASPERPPLFKPHSKFQARTRSTIGLFAGTWFEKVLEPPDYREGMDAEGSSSSTTGVNPPTTLYLKENKTRRHRSVPPHHDTLSGRLQLMLYRRLLSQLVARSPLYDFKPLWKRLGIKSSSPLPTKFLVQANLISDDTDFQTTCLDDVVTSWHELVKEANVQGVDENLKLVYRLRPLEQKKKRGKKGTAISFPEVDKCDTANTPKDMRAIQIGTWGFLGIKLLLQRLGIIPSLQRSSKNLPEFEGVDRFKIIGHKEFLHDDIELDAYLTHVLKWWRGKRKPKGVPLEHVSRCHTCEYSTDCEWRQSLGTSAPARLIHKRHSDFSRSPSASPSLPSPP